MTKALLIKRMQELTNAIGQKNLAIVHEGSAHNVLELGEFKNGSLSGIKQTLAHGTKDQLIDMIDFYFKIQSIIDENKKEQN